MQIKDIFYELQGEGTLIGLPMVFIRTYGCNLKCYWCDSKFTFNKGNSLRMSIDEIVAEVKKFGSSYVDVTGGEPMIQNDLLNLLMALKKENIFVRIDTNGTIFDKEATVFVDLWSIAPKFDEFGTIVNGIALTEFLKLDKIELKFVITNQVGLTSFCRFVDENYEVLHNVPVFVEPDSQISLREYLNTANSLKQMIMDINQKHNLNVRYLPMMQRNYYLPYKYVKKR